MADSDQRSTQKVNFRAPSVLFVEDDVDHLEVMMEVAREAGYVCSSAIGGDDAMKRIRAEKPDVCVVDLVMPGGVDGWQLVDWIRGNRDFEDIGIVVVSGHWDPGRDVGRARFVPKPVSPETLLRALAHAVERARAEG